ncbi:MAG TPA: hypothetical protein VFQ80_07910 [Thermomicrobiales bacterium]|nr:hypothetical protein [Thermomicrobiales bacterium]
MRARPRMMSALAVATLIVSLGGLGVVSAQQAPVDANGDSVVATANRNPVANGGGENISSGDITTGNGDYTVVGDPNAVVYRSDLAGSIPTRSSAGGWVIPNTSDGMVDALLAAATPAANDPNAVPVDDSAGVPVEQPAGQAAAPMDASADVPVDDSAGVPVDDSAGVPIDASTTDTSAPAWSCANYGSWDDAQAAYEAGGGLDGDPSMVAALDPDGNGVACDVM